MTMMGAPEFARESTGAEHVRRSSIRELKSIECKTGPENPASLAATGVNNSGYRGLLQP